MKRAIAVLAAMIAAAITLCRGTEAGEPEQEMIQEVITIQAEGAPEETEEKPTPLKSFDEEDECLLAKIAMAEKGTRW